MPENGVENPVTILTQVKLFGAANPHLCNGIYAKEIKSRNMKNIQVGDSIPSFILEDQNGRKFDTKDYVGKNKLIIYFYPKDESAVCTAEACAFRDSFAEFTDEGAVVVGINSGSIESHYDFAQKNRLPFQLLSDSGNKVLKQFGIKPWLFLTGRETFVVDLNGKVAFRYRAFLDGSGHSEKVIEFLKKA